MDQCWPDASLAQAGVAVRTGTTVAAKRQMESGVNDSLQNSKEGLGVVEKKAVWDAEEDEEFTRRVSRSTTANGRSSHY